LVFDTTVVNSYYPDVISCPDCTNSLGETTQANLQSEAWLTTGGNEWDFSVVPIWIEVLNDYPHLAWEDFSGLPEVVFISDVSDSRLPASPLDSITPYAADVNDGFGGNNGETNVSFYFIAQSDGGIGDLYTSDDVADDSFAILITPGGEVFDVNRVGECVYDSAGLFEAELGAGQSGVKYNCNVTIQYYDSPGVIGTNPWEIEVIVEDTLGQNNIPGFDSGNNEEFNVMTVTEVGINPTSFDWPGLTLASGPTFDSVTVENFGNDDLDDVGVKGRDLPKEPVDGTPDIPASNFHVDSTSSCVDNPLTNDFINYVYPIAGEIDILRGGSGQELYICVKDLASVSGLTIGTYKTTESEKWEIDVVFIILSIIKFFNFNLVLFGVGVRIRKKKIKRREGKKKKSGNYNLSENDLMRLDEKLRERYDVSVGELLSEEKVDNVELQVPINIFREDVGPAEVLIKYLRENLGMRFIDIARLTNRSESSVWTSYKNAMEKHREKIEVKDREEGEELIYIPVEIFANRKLSVLECMVSYLRNKEFRNFEIAEMLNKDQRNIGVLYSRIKKKLS